MSAVENFWLFFILLVGIVSVPGMDMIFVLSNTLAGGRKAGITATGGMMTGGACHSAFGGLALSGMLHLTPVVIGPMLTIGSLYMIWIGVTLLRSAVVIAEVAQSRVMRLRKIFLQALATCLLNPKAWLFTLAVYPQFIKPDFGPVWLQTLVMALTTMAVQGAIYGGLALAAARGRDVVVTSPALTIWVGRCAGALLIGVAAFTLVRFLS